MYVYYNSLCLTFERKNITSIFNQNFRCLDYTADLSHSVNTSVLCGNNVAS